MKKRIIPIVVLLVIVAVVGLKVVRPRLMEQDVDGPLKLYGNVDIREVSLGFRVAGRLAELKVDEGEIVGAGDVMAVIDSGPVEKQLQQAQAGVAAADARLRELKNGYRVEEIEQAKAGVSVAEAQLELAKLDFERQKQLDENEVGTRQLFDASRSQFEVAQANLKAAQAKLNLLQAGVRIEVVEQAAADLQAKEALVAQLEIALADCELVSPVAGTVRSRIHEVGAVLSAGAPVFVVALDEQPWVRAYVSEASLGRIEPGMQVQIFTDSRPDQAYSGHVGFISPTAEFTPKSVQTEKLRTDLVYRFRVVVEDADAKLRQGMPVTLQL